MDDYELHQHIAEVLRQEGGHAFRAELGSLDDTGDIQTVTATGYAGEELGQVLRVQQHGFASSAPVGSHGVVLPLRGQRILAAAFGLEHQGYRQKNLPTGASALYDTSGNVVRCFTTAGIQVTAATGDVAIAAVAGDVSVRPKFGGFVYLGGDGTDGTYGFVMTSAGQSTVVKAKI